MNTSARAIAFVREPSDALTRCELTHMKRVVAVIARPGADSRRGEATSVAAANSLMNRVWMRTDSSQPPGGMRIFLADGTMMLDSCWETYRLAEWQEVSDGTLLWQEDGVNIRAEILALSENELVLRVIQDEHYIPASAPYTCPDMPR